MHPSVSTKFKAKMQKFTIEDASSGGGGRHMKLFFLFSKYRIPVVVRGVVHYWAEMNIPVAQFLSLRSPLK